MNKWQLLEVQQAPVSVKGIMERAYTAKASPRQAIKATCLRCVGYIKRDVRECTACACPLHQYRPYQAGDDDENTVEATVDSVKVASET